VRCGAAISFSRRATVSKNQFYIRARSAAIKVATEVTPTTCTMLADRTARVLLLMLVLACAAVQCTQGSAPPSALSSTAATAGQRANEDTTASADTNEEQQQQQQPQADTDDSTDDADSAEDSDDEDGSWGALGVPFTAAGAVLETAGNNVIEVLEDPSVVDIHGIEVRGGSKKGVRLPSCNLSASVVNATTSLSL
jgi:hypothetical protein